MSITVLPSTAYITSHELISGGVMGATRKASIEWDDGSLRKCYVKVYPKQDRIRKIFNELTGFLIGNALGIFQPDSAALMPLNQLFYADYGLNTANEESETWAWVTSECGQSVSGIFQLNKSQASLERNIEDTKNKYINAISLICDQKNIPQIIAFDDFIANDDRNIGNLVMTGNGNMGVIDHGEILGRIDWIKKLTQLDKSQFFFNKLLYILDQHNAIKQQTTFTVKSKAVEAIGEHEQAFISIQKQLLTWWKNILEISDIPETDHPRYLDHLFDFLHYRCQQPSALFANRIGLVA
ncbi:TPA: hypothetical protein OXT48_003262 [Acinetobacter baumannii]|nr:hypothetical protein [Acinetobacter baumannii]